MAQNEKKRQEEKDMEQKRIREYGYRVGHRESGPKNKITDVPGVRVDHATVDQGKQHTGVTVIIPGEDNPFLKKYLAAAYVHNVLKFRHFQKLCKAAVSGSIQT